MLHIIFTTQFKTCLATNQVVASCLNTDLLFVKNRSHIIHRIYVTCYNSSLPWAGKMCNMYRFCCKKEVYFLQHLFATCNSLICCKAGLIVGGKMRSIAVQLILQHYVAKQLAHFCCRFYCSFRSLNLCIEKLRKNDFIWL